MSTEISLAAYLFKRLLQLGVGSIHGVPGDYNLELLDYVEPAGLHWVGNVNELNSGYAADGYARIKGIGAIITTFGVGELSAINAIAGAYVERAPVVHIVGTPKRDIQDSRLLVHHTLNDGDYQHFSKMHTHVTVAQAVLRDPRTGPEEIDHVLKQCLLQSRPVYIAIPVDLVAAKVSSARLQTEIEIPKMLPTPELDNALTKVLDRIYTAKQPMIFADGECRALGIVNEVQALIKSTNWPTWTTPHGKGLWDEALPNFYGIYKGKYDDPALKEFCDRADLILFFGPHLSSTNTYEYSSTPKVGTGIYFTDTEIKIDNKVFRDIPARLAVAQLLQKLDLSRIQQPSTDYHKSIIGPYHRPLTFSDVSKDQYLTHDKLWRILNNFLLPGDIILGETGTSGYGVRELLLPKGARLFAPATWLSIGYMLPAAQGAALAQRELQQQSQHHGDIGDGHQNSGRTILFIGDGSFQMTVQELSTIIHNNLNVVVFLLNNDGYTIERCIHGLHERYNGVAPWQYLHAPKFFGSGEDSFTASVKNWGELEKALTDDRFTNSKGLRMIEIFLDREDVPEGPLSVFLQRERDRVKKVH